MKKFITKNLDKIDDHVYDIETESQDSNFGFPLIVNNTDSLVLSMNTKDFLKILKNLEDLFDFSNLSENHELFSNENKQVIGNFKSGTLQNFWIDEFACLRSKMYAFKCRDDSKSKLKNIFKSQPKKIEVFKNRLDGCDYHKKVKNILFVQLIMKCILN